MRLIKVTAVIISAALLSCGLFGAEAKDYRKILKDKKNELSDVKKKIEQERKKISAEKKQEKEDTGSQIEIKNRRKIGLGAIFFPYQRTAESTVDKQFGYRDKYRDHADQPEFTWRENSRQYNAYYKGETLSGKGINGTPQQSADCLLL